MWLVLVFGAFAITANISRKEREKKRKFKFCSFFVVTYQISFQKQERKISIKIVKIAERARENSKAKFDLFMYLGWQLDGSAKRPFRETLLLLFISQRPFSLISSTYTPIYELSPNC